VVQSIPGSKWLLRFVVAAGLAGALLFGACGSDDDNGDEPSGGETPSATEPAGSAGDYSDLSGDIVVDGSSTVGPITEAVAEEFGNVTDQNVRVSVGISGTGGGFEKFCLGETDINDASRPIKPDDEKEGAGCAANGIEYVEFKVAIDGLTVVVHPDNDFATCLTYSQLTQLWNEGSSVSSWNELDPSFPDEDITLFGPGPDSGTFDYFTEEVNGTADKSRSDYTPSEDDNVLVQGVENEANALGYFGFAYYQGAGSELKALQISKDQHGKGTPVPAGDQKGCVAPTAETINDNSYPLSRPLFIYVSKEALARPEVRGFIEFYLTEAKALVRDVGYVPLPDAEYAEGMEALASN
jgi:phosphate transport system substrate-binding protein